MSGVSPARAALRRVILPPARLALRRVFEVRTRRWAPASHLFAVGDGVGWSVDEDAEHLAATARRLGYEVGPSGWAPFVGGQVVFHASQFEAFTPRWLASSQRLGVAYLHGRPGTPGAPEFDRCFEALRSRPGRFARVQVTHGEMHDIVLTAGVEPGRVFRIPIGIDLEHFPLGDREARRRAREELGLPASAFVAGSFQKDGVGWREGLEPKLVKGPDTLVAALGRLRELAPELVVLLAGPARGFVRRELERRGIPYRHILARSRGDLARAYQALDVYLVTSRQEGGPKAVLEAMASGVPLVSTRVGQAQELVEPGVNGALVEVDDAEGVAGWASHIRDDGAVREALRVAGRTTAESLAHERLDMTWDELLRGFVEIPATARGSR